MEDVPLTELVISPRWAATVGEVDGTAHVVLRVQHPRLGPLDFLLPGNDPIELAAALEKTWERRDEKRMGRATPQAAENVVVAHPNVQPARASWWSRVLRRGPSVTSKFTTTRRQRSSGRRNRAG